MPRRVSGLAMPCLLAIAAACGAANASTPASANALESVKFLGVSCSDSNAKASHNKTMASLAFSFSDFKLVYDPDLLGPHSASCKVLLETTASQAASTGVMTRIKSAEISLIKGEGEAFKAELGMAHFDSTKVHAATPKVISSTDLPAKVVLDFPQAKSKSTDMPRCPAANLSSSAKVTHVEELTVTLMAQEAGERQLSTILVDGITNIVTEQVSCVADDAHQEAHERDLAEAQQEASDALPQISVTGFGDGPTGPCSFLFDGGKLKSVSRNMPGDKIYFQIYTEGTKRGLVEYWDTMESERVACNINIRASKKSAFRMKLTKAVLPLAEHDPRNGPMAVTMTAAQQRSQGDARKFVFSSADAAPTAMSITELKLEEEQEFTKCSNDHNFRLTFSFKAGDAEHVQHIQVFNGPTFMAVHTGC